MSTEPAISEFPPGPSGLPIVGAMPSSILGGLEFWERMAHEYGDVVYWKGPGSHFYQASDPKISAMF